MIKKRRMKWTAALLVLALALTACGADGGTREIHKVDWVTSPAYIPEDIELPVQTGDLIGCCTDGEYLYVLADEKAGDEVRSVLSRVSLAEGAAEILPQYEAPQPPEDAFINRFGPIAGPDGTLWVYEAWSMIHYDLPEDFDPEKEILGKYYTGQDDFHHLRQLDPETGKQKKLVDLSEAVRTLDVSDVFDVSGFAVDGKGNIYFAGTGGVAVLDGSGKHLFTLETGAFYNYIQNSSGDTMALLPDGTVAALLARPNGGREVRVIDPAARDWGKTRYEIPGGVDLLYDGTGGFLFFFTQGTALYAWEPDGKEPRLLLTWPNTGIEGSTMCFAPMEEGKLAVLSLQYTGALTETDDWYKGRLRLSLLSPTDKKPEDGRIRLVYGAIGEDSVLQARIRAFNRENPDYVIELRNYAGDGVDLHAFSYDKRSAVQDAAEKLLNAEVTSGNIPDIWDSSLPIGRYAKLGVMEDLWPWIDGDGELGGRDALMAHALDCIAEDGKLYKAGASFYIGTVAARSDVVGRRTGWTLEEMLAYYEGMPEGSAIMSPFQDGSVLLELILEFDESRWIDWSAGTCHFDTEDFKKVLELCSLVKADPDFDFENDSEAANFLAGRQLMMPVILNGPSDLLYYDALCAGPEHLTDYAAYLNENNIYSSYVDGEGNWRDRETTVICPALSGVEQARKEGLLYQWYPMAADAVIGALEGGGYASYVGYPSQSGSGSYFSFYNCLGMSAACQHKEGAWAYIRRCLLPGGNDSVRTDDQVTHIMPGFPVNKEAFDKVMSPEWFVDGEGEYLLDGEGNRIEKPKDMLIPVPNTGGGTVPVGMAVFELAPNEAQKEAFLALYNAIGPSQAASRDLLHIIREQVQAYFAGDKSLEETAALIQNRAALYVNENR